MNSRSHDRPVARTDGFLVEEVGAETVVLDTGSGGVHCLGPLAAAVHASCDGSKSIAEIAELAGARLAEPVSIEQVELALGELDERGLLAVPDGLENGFSRRALLRKTAVATAAVSAAPLITSIVTPAFAQGTFVDERCPGGLCAAQAKGDDYCACNNDCPCTTGNSSCPPGDTTNSKCSPYCLTAPYVDSCECLQCPSPNRGNPDPTNPSHYDLGDFSGTTPGPGKGSFQLSKTVCPAEWFTTNSRPACGSSGPCNGGCESGKNINGVCLRIDPTGDTSEPCPN